jgi:Fe-S-cluster containining protein
MAKQTAERARQLVRERIGLVRAAMQRCDDDIDRELATLASRGVVPSCSKGCAHCCRQEILVSRAEAETIIDWLETSSSPAQLEALRARLRDWLVWYHGDFKRRVAAGDDRQMVAYEHGPGCVALLDGACTIYPARPLMCRMHFVTSSADACRPAGDPAFVSDEPLALIPSISRVAQPAVLQIRGGIERQGTDFWATVHLLPEWLAHLLRIEEQPWRTAPPLQLR